MIDSTDKLQASIRRLQLWNAVLLGSVIVLAVAVVADARSGDKLLRAELIQLVSPQGEVLAELAAPDGDPGLYLKDENGVNRVSLFHADEGTGLYVMDSDGVTRIGIAQFAHGGGGVALHGEASKGAAVLYFKKEGSLRFFDAEGELTYEVTAPEPQVEN